MHKPPGNAAPWVRTRVACTGAILALALAGAAQRASAQTDVPPERRAAREWYQDARFGMFIHWGVYSLLGDGEWVMQNRKITVPEYEWLATTFNPVKFDAKTWVSLGRAAGTIAASRDLDVLGIVAANYIARIARLDRQIALTYLSTHPEKGFHRLDIKPVDRDVEIRHPSGFTR